MLLLCFLGFLLFVWGMVGTLIRGEAGRGFVLSLKGFMLSLSDGQ